MPRKPTFALDCDGLLADFATPALKIIHTITGVEYKLDDFPEYDFLSDPRVRPYIREFWDRMKTRGSGSNFRVLPGVRHGLRKLRKEAYLFVCTAGVQGDNFFSERVKWLEALGFDFKTEMVFTWNKNLINADVLVDDHPNNVNFFKATHPESVAVLWRSPVETRDFDVIEGVEKASDWDTLVDLARRLRCR